MFFAEVLFNDVIDPQGIYIDYCFSEGLDEEKLTLFCIHKNVDIGIDDIDRGCSSMMSHVAYLKTADFSNTWGDDVL